MTLAIVSSDVSSHGSAKARNLDLVRQEALEPRLEGLSSLHASVLADACEQYRKAFDLMTTRFLAHRIISAAVADCNFEIVSGPSNLQYADFPLDERSIDEVSMAQNGILRPVRTVLEQYPLESFVSPLTALRYAAKNPKAQFVAPLNVLFLADGKLWCMTLMSWYERSKMVWRQCFAETPFDAGERFLVLRNRPR